MSVGHSNDGNCYPFGCAAGDARTAYQQVYSSSAFSGPMTISGLKFFEFICYKANCPINTDEYTIYLSYSKNSVDRLSAVSPSANIGVDYKLFGDFHLGGSMPGVTELDGKAFSYNPKLGDLLVTVYIGQAAGSLVSNGYESFYSADYTGDYTSRAYFGETNGQDSIGLVTQFVTPFATPEPASAALLAGLGALAFAGWKRRVRG